jgi:segregation and condensation protein B
MNRVVRLSEAKAEPVDHPVHTHKAEPRMSSDVENEARTEAQIDPMHTRIIEALLFAASEPVAETALAAALPPQTDMAALLSELQRFYDGRGVNLMKVAGKWQFRTAKDLSFLLHKEAVEERRLSRAAMETLAIISYHQPVTRAEIEDIRGVMVSKGTVDALMEVGWVRIRGRRRTPGRPVTYGTTDAFLVHFGLEAVSDLPGMEELKAAGFLDAVPPAGFTIPNPSDQLAPDEDPYEGEEEEDFVPDELLPEPETAPEKSGE